MTLQIRLTPAGLRSWDNDDARRYQLGFRNGKPLVDSEGQPLLPLRNMARREIYDALPHETQAGAVWVETADSKARWALLQEGEWEAA
jgi:hypothetical protein